MFITNNNAVNIQIKNTFTITLRYINKYHIIREKMLFYSLL